MKRLLTATALLMASTGPRLGRGRAAAVQLGQLHQPELLEKFKAETGITVTVTDYDSNDTALAKIEAGGHGFDLVVPSANYVPVFIEKGLVVELDQSKLPNHGNIAPEWMSVPGIPAANSRSRGSGARPASR
jgi:spermidine/putrescine transport system substrate-binding protein